MGELDLDLDLRTYTPVVERIARRYGLRSDPAESLSRAWDGFHKALRTYNPNHPSGVSFESWAAWTAKGRLEALRRAEALRASRERVARVADAREWADAQSTSPTTPDVEPREAEALRMAVEALPERQRKAVECVIYRDLTTTEAALELGVPRQAVASRLERAVRALRESFGPRVSNACRRP